MAKANDTLHSGEIQLCVKGPPAVFQNFAVQDANAILDLMVASQISGKYMLKINKTTRGNSAKKGIHIGDPSEYGLRLSLQLGDNGSCRSCMLIKAGEKHSPSDRHLYERLHRKLLKTLVVHKERVFDAAVARTFFAPPPVVPQGESGNSSAQELRAEEIPFLNLTPALSTVTAPSQSLVPPEPLDLNARIREQRTALMHTECELARVKAERQEAARKERVLSEIAELLGTLITLTERARDRH